MSVQVRIGGVPILGATEVVDSTIYRTDGWSGDYQASCKWAAPATFVASWFKRGALYEHVEFGKRTFGGLLSEPMMGDDGMWSLNAYGFGAEGLTRQAIYDPVGADPLQPWSIPNNVVDYAITDSGLPWVRYVSLGTVSVADTDGKIRDVMAVLLLDANGKGKRVWIDSLGEVTYVSDPTVPTFMVAPSTAYVGTADDDYVSHLFGYFVSSVDGTTGAPDGWEITDLGTANLAKAAEVAAQYGYKAATVDLTELGYMSSSDAQDIIDGRYALVGGRMSITNGFDLTRLNLMVPGVGPASPMTVRAGQMLRIPDIMDTRLQPTTRASTDVILGQVTRYHDEQRATALPVGFAARDFAGALAAAQKPDAGVDAA